jgi:hypothetical protein
MLLKHMDLEKRLTSRIAGQGADFMRRLGYVTKEDDDLLLLQERGDVFFNPYFKRDAAIGIARYMERVLSGGRDEGICSWLFNPNFARLQEMARDNRIRGFNVDLFEQGFTDNAELLIDEYGIRNLVLYVCNIPECLDMQYRHAFKGDSAKADAAMSAALDNVLDPLAAKVDRLWVIDSRAEKNRVLCTKP